MPTVVKQGPEAMVSMLRMGLEELVPKLETCVAIANKCENLISDDVVEILEKAHTAAAEAQKKVNV